MALFVHLLRKEIIDEDDVIALSDSLSDEAKHLANCAIVEAAAPSVADWRAERARARFRVVDKD